MATLHLKLCGIVCINMKFAESCYSPSTKLIVPIYLNKYVLLNTMHVYEINYT